MSEVMVGSRIGNYRIVREIGRGGMGAVFEGVYDELKRRAAIKILQAEYNKNNEMLTRFFNEAKAANIIGHPNIVSIYEHGYLPSGHAYIIMEFLDGVPLSIRRPECVIRPEPWIFRFVRQIASGLAVAHQKGVIHRDLKPENIMLISDPETPGGERVKILDFGIAKVEEPSELPNLDILTPMHDRRPGKLELLTKPGTFLGTARYTSPEQCIDSGSVSEKTDVYSLGIILYEFLAGRPPFTGNNRLEYVAKHLSQDPESLISINPAVDSHVNSLVMSMLSKEPSNRPTMFQVAQRLEAFANPRPHWEATEQTVDPATNAVNGDNTISKSTKRLNIAFPSIGELHTGLQLTNERRISILILMIVALCLLFVTYIWRYVHSSRERKINDAPANVTHNMLIGETKLDERTNYVQWTIQTDPAGATIVQAESNSYLGRTPWQQKYLATPGFRILVLHLDGYDDRKLSLRLDKDENHNVTLVKSRDAEIRLPMNISTKTHDIVSAETIPDRQRSKPRPSTEPTNRTKYQNGTVSSVRKRPTKINITELPTGQNVDDKKYIVND